MPAINNGIDPTVTVENEKQTITIGNNLQPSSIEKPAITVEKEKIIIDEIEKHCRKWKRISNWYLASILLFGLTAVITSVIVSIYTGSPETVMKISTIKTLACISTISLGVLTAFNLVNNHSNSRNAWRSLNAALMMYTAGSISIQQLIEHYQKGENQLGTLSFQYGTATEKPATYTQDIVAADLERKQKANKADAKKQNQVPNANLDAEQPLKKATNGVAEVEENSGHGG